MGNNKRAQVLIKRFSWLVEGSFHYHFTTPSSLPTFVKAAMALSR